MDKFAYFTPTRCNKATSIHKEMYLHRNHNHRKQSITCSNIDYWFTCTEARKQDMLRLEPIRQDKNHKWVKSDPYLLRHVKCRPCCLVIYGGSEISCPLLRCLVCREWAGVRYQEVNRCEIFCDEETMNLHSNSGSFLLLPREHVPTYAQISHAFSPSHQLHLHTCLQTVWTDCHFPLGSVSLPFWPLFSFTPGHNKNLLHLWLKPHNLKFLSFFLKQPLWLELSNFFFFLHLWTHTGHVSNFSCFC